MRYERESDSVCLYVKGKREELKMKVSEKKEKRTREEKERV
jgi:hypothetical protein